LAVLTGITLGIAMGMVLLVTVHCARYRYLLLIRRTLPLNPGRTGPPGILAFARLVRRPGGPPSQMLKYVNRLVPTLLTEKKSREGEERRERGTKSQ